jgi:DNA primase
MREELKQAAAQRLGSVPARRTAAASETERVLLRALVLPEGDLARECAAAALVEHPEWYEGWAAAALFEALAHGATSGSPLDAAPDDETRAMLAEVLASQPETEHDPTGLRRSTPQTMLEQVENALVTMKERYLKRRQEELRAGIAAAERRGDSAMVETLTLEKMKVDRALREL